MKKWQWKFDLVCEVDGEPTYERNRYYDAFGLVNNHGSMDTAQSIERTHSAVHRTMCNSHGVNLPGNTRCEEECTENADSLYFLHENLPFVQKNLFIIISCTCTGICVLLTHLENCLQKVFQTFSTTIVTLKLNDLDKTASKISVSIR